MTPKFTSTYMKTLGWGFFAFGLVWVTTAFAGFDAPGRNLIDLLDWPLDGTPTQPSQEARWMGAIGAGLSSGLGMFFVFVVAPLIKHQDTGVRKTIRRGVLITMIIWFIVDGVGSVASGVPSNVVFNFIFFLAATVPVLALKDVRPT